MKNNNNRRTNILVCIDGSEESYLGLRYASKLTMDRTDTDVTLLFVRTQRTHRSTGMMQDVVQDHLKDWDIELPGMALLKKGRDILIEKGFFRHEWENHSYDRKPRGTEAHNHSIKYTSQATGQTLTLIVRDGKNLVSAILDEAHFYAFDFLILSSTKEDGPENYIDGNTAISIAIEHDGTVILVREMEEGHGHFVYLHPSDSAIELAVRDAEIAARCGCPVHLYAVAENEEEKSQAQKRVEKAEQAIKEAGYGVSGSQVDIGEPVWRITENGRKHSLIVISEQDKRSFFQQLFKGNQAHDILRKARNSVMIIR